MSFALDKTSNLRNRHYSKDMWSHLQPNRQDHVSGSASSLMGGKDVMNLSLSNMSAWQVRLFHIISVKRVKLTQKCLQ